MKSVSGHLLAVDTGSSSVKCAAYNDDSGLSPICTAAAEGVGASDGRITGWAPDSGPARFGGNPRDYGEALDRILDWIDGRSLVEELRGVGHRIVHGGPGRFDPARATPDLVAAIREWGSVDPDHVPQALSAVERVGARYPSVPQLLCFDTGFHRTMPPVARRYPLPRPMREAGVERFGFHGLSYEFIVGEMRKLEPVEVGGRTVIAHLGSGASMAAVHRGRGLDTSMGFTPTGGLIMSSRTGDLDPGILPFLMERFRLDRAGLLHLLNREGGLRALSGGEGDMKSLLARSATDVGAAEAVESFCYQARKYLGAFVAVLNGLDTLVFTGGIGENSPEVRARICAGWEFLGMRLDPDANRRGAAVVTTDASSVRVRVMKTEENRVIAQHLQAYVRAEQ